MSHSIVSSRSFLHSLRASRALLEGTLLPNTSKICRSLFLTSRSSDSGLYAKAEICALNVVGRISPRGGVKSSSSSEMRLIGSMAGRFLLDMVD